MVERILVVILIVWASSCDFVRTGQNSDNTPLSNMTVPDTLVENRNEGRAAWQKPNLVVNLLGDLSDKVVADIGAGTGYFAFRLLFKAQKVIALDIDPDMIYIMENLKLELPKEYQEKFETRLVSVDDSKLEQGEADVILIMNTITYIDDRLRYLEKLKDKLKPNGSLVIMDFKMKRMLDIEAPDKEYRLYADILEEELIEAGYIDIRTNDQLLEYQYITIAHITE